MASDLYSRIYGQVRRIPPGKVGTYGQIARLAGALGHARVVGYALNALGGPTDVPWHRVVNAKRLISERADPDAGRRQRARLEAEGVTFDARGRIGREHLWDGRSD